jgi:branched-chain amino acid transport system permease protein
MVLAMVVIGGAGSVPGAIVGALLIAGYDLLAIPLLGSWFDRLRQSSGGGLAVFDIRALNSLYFGLALYLTVLFRERRRRSAPR